MKYCSHCGDLIADEAVVCPKCGCPVSAAAELDVPSTGLNILSFLIPLIGLILFIVYSSKSPRKAKEIGKWSLIGFVVGLLFNILIL